MYAVFFLTVLNLTFFIFLNDLEVTLKNIHIYFTVLKHTKPDVSQFLTDLSLVLSTCLEKLDHAVPNYKIKCH